MVITVALAQPSLRYLATPRVPTCRSGLESIRHSHTISLRSITMVMTVALAQPSYRCLATPRVPTCRSGYEAIRHSVNTSPRLPTCRSGLKVNTTLSHYDPIRRTPLGPRGCPRMPLGPTGDPRPDEGPSLQARYDARRVVVRL